ncbi:hydrolase, alpha/beta fold family, putative [Luminiphilus syltensis NOR5-1B]|uniref:Hydrolase, alpha/beta fold family, putative n=1 Tax=Luminiphilus syltensis NOR5-1B TaxID=565045 RepID=B8KTZ6_9GAMM|nr:alpha/beta hydrolase [Luminiphilus syltensis]EED36192.1 hydrolase, alpha/beta fold family, putative [Luminiphilus syltensis NOR5-1B]
MATLETRDGAQIYYEVIGEGDPVLCLGGWGTFCHGEERGLPFGLIDQYQVIIMDYRGLAESTDNLETPATMGLYAEDAIAILDHLGLKNVHLLGMVGIGACICQQIAIRRPDLARTLINTGAWAKVDAMLREHLRLFLDIHEKMGWADFQRFACAMSFDPDFYDANIDRLLGENGPWKELKGNLDTHRRFIEASVDYDAIEDLRSVTVPAFVLHAEMDVVTGPRVTQPIEDALPNAVGVKFEDAAHVLAGKDQRQRFGSELLGFLNAH